MACWRVETQNAAEKAAGEGGERAPKEPWSGVSARGARRMFSSSADVEAAEEDWRSGIGALSAMCVTCIFVQIEA